MASSRLSIISNRPFDLYLSCHDASSRPIVVGKTRPDHRGRRRRDSRARPTRLRILLALWETFGHGARNYHQERDRDHLLRDGTATAPLWHVDAAIDLSSATT